jgi:ferritin-like metal-binding protein YciE
MDSIRELIIEQMKDLYDAEKRLVRALPKMAKAASNPELKKAFESHLEETRGHVERLEQGFELLGDKPKAKPCVAMKGLIEEGEETIKEGEAGPLLDSAIICAAQKVEHYEIAGYGTLRAWAKTRGFEDLSELFTDTLGEEEAADEKLTEIAETVLSEAAEVSTGEDEEERGSAVRKGSAGKSESAGRSRRRAG